MRPEHADAFVQGARLYVVVTATAVALLGTLQVRRWRTFMPENQLAWLAVAALNFSSWFGCLDQWLHNGPGGIRTYIAAVGVTFALYAVLHHPVHRAARWWRVRQIIRNSKRSQP